MTTHLDKHGQLFLTTLMRVCYVPQHAHENVDHPDVEWGYVSSWNDKLVFVKFDRSLTRFGWDGTTSQSCNPTDLILHPEEAFWAPKTEEGSIEKETEGTRPA